MVAYILRRLWQMLPTMAGVVVLVFVLFNWVGGDPSYLLAGKMADARAIAGIRAQLGLDEPWYVQLGIFVLTPSLGIAVPTVRIASSGSAVTCFDRANVYADTTGAGFG